MVLGDVVVPDTGGLAGDLERWATDVARDLGIAPDHLEPYGRDKAKVRLEALAGSRLTLDGVLVLFSQGSRSQETNRQEVRERLLALIRLAAIRPKRRRPPRPTLASKLRHQQAKIRRARVKSTPKPMLATLRNGIPLTSPRSMLRRLPELE